MVPFDGDSRHKYLTMPHTEQVSFGYVQRNNLDLSSCIVIIWMDEL